MVGYACSQHAGKHWDRQQWYIVHFQAVAVVEELVEYLRPKVRHSLAWILGRWCMDEIQSARSRSRPRSARVLARVKQQAFDVFLSMRSAAGHAGARAHALQQNDNTADGPEIAKKPHCRHPRRRSPSTLHRPRNDQRQRREPRNSSSVCGYECHSSTGKRLRAVAPNPKGYARAGQGRGKQDSCRGAATSPSQRNAKGEICPAEESRATACRWYPSRRRARLCCHHKVL